MTEVRTRRRSPLPPLALAIVLEVSATLAFRAAGGFEKPWWLLVVIPGYVGSTLLLGVVLKRGLGVGVAYGLWSAIGVAATAVVAAFLFAEALTPLSVGGIVLVIVGVLLVELGDRPAGERSS
ncbi:SMR family transporter [Amnibacterium sp. CER49]|uniref:DMT family transporter n=1 Tax=Amnibacterium sp. CER49 TaxID=3039161 RepID=UPI002449F49D|nr:SMR family transporter [Amnibacterium sp. CER49]MDH2442825.1 SMR family transporter [Amnibacterium sp. CER49]